jgi:transposase
MVIIGVDPHPGSHTAAALDPNGMLLDNLSVSNDQAGLANLKRWALGFRARCWAIEGAGNPFAAPLVAALLDQGEQVINIHPGLTSQYRARRSKKKNDLIDAVNVARACY